MPMEKRGPMEWSGNYLSLNYVHTRIPGEQEGRIY